MDPEEQVDGIVDEDDGDIADLIDSLVDEEPTEDETESLEADEESSEEDSTPDGDTPGDEEESEDATDAPTGGVNPELEALRQERDALAAERERARQYVLAQQQRQQRIDAEKALTERLNNLDDIPDPDMRNREMGAILSDVRTQERNLYMPQLNAAEQEAEVRAQGLVALHYATEGFINDIVSGEIDVTGKTAEEVMAMVQASALEYMEYDSAEVMQRDIARRNEIKAQANARATKLEAENLKLKKRLKAMEIAGNPANKGGGTGRGNSATPAALANKDDGSYEWMINNLDVPDDSEVTTGAY